MPLWCIGAAGTAVVALIGGLSLSGAAQPGVFADPGALVRWGLPVAQAVAYVSMGVTIAALVFAVFILPQYEAGSVAVHRSPRKHKRPPSPVYHPLYLRALSVATISAVVWALGSFGVLLLGYADITGVSFSADPSFTRQLSYFVLHVSIGQAWLVVALIAVGTSILCCAARSVYVVFFAAILAGVGIVPLSLIGHAAGADDHTGAVNSLGLHLLGMSLWLGGIVLLACLMDILTGDEIKQVVTRFSRLAFLGFWLVVLSGIVSAAFRIKTAGQVFGTPYGLLVVSKILATIVLGGIGLLHRRWVIPRLSPRDGLETNFPTEVKEQGRRWHERYGSVRLLWQLIAVELVVMGCVAGLAVALGRSAPPTPEKLPDLPSVARIISGYDLPPPLEPYRMFTQWRFDWLWVALILCAAIFYFRGVTTLRERGTPWRIGRTVCWFTGLAILFYVTSGGLAVYGHVLFSAHMVAHMVLTMIVPFFLVLGAPVTLCLKALRPRSDGSHGFREWLLAILHSRFSAFLTNPIVAAVNFAGSIIVFYYTPLLRFAMYTHVGHEWMYVHFLLTGYIFALTMVGIDPLPKYAAYPMRLITLIATMAFHAFFGIGLMMSSGLLLSSWFGNMGRSWGDPAIADQQAGGAIAWGLGEIPTMVLAVVLAVQWSIADRKEARRVDRHADRTADAQLNAYNEMLARLARRDYESVR